MIVKWAVFISGFCVMSFELVGTRILAPFFGSSIIVWTSVIGIVLSSLTLGYSWGGKLSRQKVSPDALAGLLLGASLSVFFTATIGKILLEKLSLSTNLISGSILSSLLLFGPANFFFGAVFPYCARLAIKSVKNSGSIIGHLSSISALGSIAGVFVTGFLLIPNFGSNNILYLGSGLLFVFYLTIAKKGKAFWTLLLFLIFGARFLFFNVTTEGVLRETDSLYSHIIVSRTTDVATNRPVIKLSTGKYEIQSSMFLDKDDDLVDQYKKFFRLAPLFTPKMEKVLMVGGGAYSSPKDFLKKYSDVEISVVEPDKIMTNLAETYFHLPNNPNLKIYHQDGRTFLNNAPENSYDIVIVDAFQSGLSIPFEITTIESLGLLKNTLSEKGVVMVNIISAIEGPGSKFFRSEYNSFLMVFPKVFVFLVQNPKNTKSIQNIILLASKDKNLKMPETKDPELKNHLSHLVKQEIGEGKELTDDHAPVEFQLLPLYKYINI